MELVACNFEVFPQNSLTHEFLRPMLNQCTEVRFPYSIGERNSNQFTFDFDSKLKSQLILGGGSEAHLKLPPTIVKEYDFVLSFAGKLIVVEVEKANREKILYDFLKFHMYLQNGADIGLLFLPKNYSHKSGEWDLFDWGKTRYQQARAFGFGTPGILDRILIVGCQQCTIDGVPLDRKVRAALIVNRQP
jgi:hypothetical protein